MRTSYRVPGALAVALVCFLGASLRWLDAQQRTGSAVAIDPDDIGGVVSSSKGPEAGVWVIAETTDLPTRLTRIVVTDDQGRYVIPDLPRGANYQVFVRGYGLVDSPRVKATRGQQLNLTAVLAPDGKAAAQIYPATYWLALLEAPSEQFTETVKTSCMNCHQIGDKATREIPANLGTFASSLDAWDRRVRSGPSGGGMSGTFMRLGPERKAFADWTDRIAAGAYPKQAPPRPTGIERNIVVTLWDWATPMSFNHTHAATDRRNPTVNANGKIYAPDVADDSLVWLDPLEHSVGAYKIPTREPLPPAARILAASAYWGEEQPWKGSANARSAGMDQLGRVWMATRIRDKQPEFCKSGSTNKFAQYFPMNRTGGGSQVAFFDPKTEKFTLIDTCFTADHNEFGETPDNPLFFGQNDSIGWVGTTLFDKTHDEQAAQGWCPGVLDTNGDGTITTGWTEPNQPSDPTKDHGLSFGCYAISASPADGSVWCTGIGINDRQIVRIDRGSNPPQTCKAEVYQPPSQSGIKAGAQGGVEVDSQGVVWANWRTSDYITSFDRRKCKGPLNGPNATGPHCPEGWSFYRKADPTFQGSSVNADLNYLIFVDRHDAAGLGKDAAVTYPVNSDSVVALLPGGRFATLRVPYPMGFYTRNAHARIDDAKAGWKGRGLWSEYMSFAVWHTEGSSGTTGGKGQKPKVVKFQVRPNPLAK